MSHVNIQDYNNDYSSGAPGYDQYSRNADVAEDKPISASDITAIAESTINQLLMRDDRRSEDRRSRSHRRSRSRSRGRSRSRSRDRSRDRRDRSRSRERRRERSRDRSRERSREKPVNRLEKLKDPRIVTLKGLKSFHKETDIRRKLVEERMKFRDIRVIFNKANQTGTAFVEFQSENEAARWVRHNRGMLKVSGEHLTMDLNKPVAAPKKDWICKPCGEKNHYARDSCYSCQSDRQEAPEKPRLSSRSPEPSDKDAVPSNVLMLRGLDYRTTEEQVVRKIRDLTEIPIKDVRLITDKYTNKSRGFCFVEVASVLEGKNLLNCLQRQDPPFQISSRKVTVTFQREPGEKNEAADAAIAAAQWSATTKTDTAVTSVQSSDMDTTPQEAMPKTIGSYVWDQKSGFYYDQSSGLYYDPKTKYYFNPTDEKYYYWNATTNQYDTVHPNGTDNNKTHAQAGTPNSSVETTDKGKTTNKATKAMNAKKIQKDMERWAKAKNRQQAKTAPKAEPEPQQQPVADNQPETNQQSGNSISLKIAQDYADPVFQLAQSGSAAPPPPPSIFPISNMNNTTLTDEQINRQYEDLTAIACLLCKRKFPSVENLKRHQELSDLHKTSLATERQKMASSATSNFGSNNQSSVLDYRDRAAERRNKFGVDSNAPAPPNKYMRR